MFGNEERMLLVSRFDNLGKGASRRGRAVHQPDARRGRVHGPGALRRESFRNDRDKAHQTAASAPRRASPARASTAASAKTAPSATWRSSSATSPPPPRRSTRQNLVKGAPLEVTKKHLENGIAHAVICNSGNANTCNADGIEIAEATCALLASELGIAPEDVIVASTGVIGQRLSLEPFKTGIPELCKALGPNSHDVGRGHHDDGHAAQGDRRRVHRGRQDLPPGRHRQGQRHDTPEHGDHARAS